MLKQILSRLPRKSFKSDNGELSTPRGQGGSPVSGKVNAIKRTSSAVFPTSVVTGIEPLVSFKDVLNGEKMNLFLSKLNLCCVTFNFYDPSKNALDKDVKRHTLIELVDFVASGPSSKFPEPAVFAMVRMCAVNLFRVFPPNYRSKGGGSGSGGGGAENDDDEPMFDPSWSHLQIIYDLLLKFITSPSLDAKLAKKYVDHSFILKLLDLFDSEDPRERECLKTILHRVYGKFMVHRPFIRKAMSNIFHQFVFETEKRNGIAELLEIFGSVISGFALPLKEEHKMFLWRVLIPLHKSKSVAAYFQQLSYCITQFVDKDPKLANVVVQGLLKYWPITNSQKEVMFLGELEEILEGTDMFEFQKVMIPLFSRIACCINSSHFQVAERALFLWNNDQILNLIGHNRQIIHPIIFPALERNAQGHWNQAVLNLTYSVRKIFHEMDEPLFIECQKQFMEDEAKLSSIAEKRNATWVRLENAANLQPMTGNIAVLVSPSSTSIACQMS